MVPHNRNTEVVRHSANSIEYVEGGEASDIESDGSDVVYDPAPLRPAHHSSASTVRSHQSQRRAASRTDRQPRVHGGTHRDADEATRTAIHQSEREDPSDLGWQPTHRRSQHNGHGGSSHHVPRDGATVQPQQPVSGAPRTYAPGTAVFDELWQQYGPYERGLRGSKKKPISATLSADNEVHFNYEYAPTGSHYGRGSERSHGEGY